MMTKKLARRIKQLKMLCDDDRTLV